MIKLDLVTFDVFRSLIVNDENDLYISQTLL